MSVLEYTIQRLPGRIVRLSVPGEQPVCWTPPPDVKSVCLAGLVRLLEYCQQEGLSPTRVRIHGDLHAANVWNRYLKQWQRQHWHKAKGQPVHDKPWLIKLSVLHPQFPDLQIVGCRAK